jgi:hypothetical protein
VSEEEARREMALQLGSVLIFWVRLVWGVFPGLIKIQGHTLTPSSEMVRHSLEVEGRQLMSV